MASENPSGSRPLKSYALLPAHLREHAAQVLAELVHLPAQVHVLHQLVDELLELGPLLGRHRVQHRLHRRHALRHDLEQLVERLRVLGEEVAEACSMNSSNSGSSPRSRRSSIWLSSASMSFMRCICFGLMFCMARGHLVDVVLHELLAELVQQLLEPCLAPPAT